VTERQVIELWPCGYTARRSAPECRRRATTILVQTEFAAANSGGRQEMTKLITYVDSSEVEPLQFRPGSEWSVLFEDAQTGQRAILVKWKPGYQMGQVDHHESNEIVFVLSGTFVENNRASSPGTYIHHRAGSSHQAYTPDGCTFLEVVTGQRARSGRARREQVVRFGRLATCIQQA
jgi:hypothetical protein